MAAPTRGPNVLDLVLVRGLQQVSAHPRAPSIASDHEEVVIGFSAETPPPARPTRSSAYSYRRADFDGLRQALSVTPWDLLDDGDVDEAVSTFYALVDAAVRDHVPVVTLKKTFSTVVYGGREASAACQTGIIRTDETSAKRRAD